NGTSTTNTAARGSTPTWTMTSSAITLPSGFAWQRNSHGQITGRLTVSCVSPFGGDPVTTDEAITYSDFNTCSQLWNLPPPPNSPSLLVGVAAMPALSADENTAYFGLRDHYLYAVNTATGTLKWRIQLDNEIFGSPAVCQGYIFVGTGGPNAVGHSGRLWKITDQGSTAASQQIYYSAAGFATTPTLDAADQRIFIGSAGKMYAFGFSSTTPLWSYQTLSFTGHLSTGEQISTGGISTSAVYAPPPAQSIWTRLEILLGLKQNQAGRVYVATDATMIYAFDAGSGKVVWQKTIAILGGHSSAPSIGNNKIYVDDAYHIQLSQNRLHIYNLDGSELPSVYHTSYNSSYFNQEPGVVVFGNYIYTQSSSGILGSGTSTVVKVAENGAITPLYNESGLDISASPALGKVDANGTNLRLYVPTNNNEFVSINVQNSADFTTYPLPGNANSPIMSSKGVLYFLCSTGNLVAIQTPCKGMVHSWPCGHGDAQNTGSAPADAHLDFSHQGLGNVQNGSGSFDSLDQNYSLCGAGKDIGGTGDSCDFSYNYFSGDFVIIAQVSALDNTNAWAKAGVMIRKDLSSSSANAAMVVTPSNGVQFQYRRANGDTTSIANISGYSPGNAWVMLKRVFNTVYGYVSSDSVTFTQVGQVTFDTGAVYVGLVHAALNDSVSGCAQFTDILLSGIPTADYDSTQWTQLSTPFDWDVTNAFAVTGSSGTNLFAGTQYAGVYRSTDAGANWAQVNSGLANAPVLSLAASGNNLFAGMQNGIFLSTNNGTSWIEADSGLAPYTAVHALAVNGTNIFAGTYYHGVYLSSDSGISWIAVDSGLPSGCAVYAFAVIGNYLFAGTFGQGVYLSTNNGVSWSATGLTSAYVNSLTAIGSNLYAGTGGYGVMLSVDNGATWTAVNNGMTSNNVYTFENIGTNLFAGTYAGYPAGISLTSDYGENWSGVNTGMYNNTTIISLGVYGRTLFAGTIDGHIYRGTP
ncbi:MAG: PQQ-binding-like beta-propeller repeat protein, partial [Chitinivibrionales bacterium]|nr:PQQ-binding-like beta-propeller repeat protein [Chitinivibrionales bacterium]